MQFRLNNYWLTTIIYFLECCQLNYAEELLIDLQLNHVGRKNVPDIHFFNFEQFIRGAVLMCRGEKMGIIICQRVIESMELLDGYAGTSNYLYRKLEEIAVANEQLDLFEPYYQRL